MRENELFISSRDYDYGSIRKVAVVNSYLGEIRIHDAPGGYLITFYGCPVSPRQSIEEFTRYLVDLTNNKWSH